MEATTYKKLFDDVTADVVGEIELEKIYPTDKYEVQSPSGEWIPIIGMMKKAGSSVKITTESGKEFHGELRHSIKNAKGHWVYLQDCESVLLSDGSFEKVIQKEFTDETEFYDVSLPPPHEYVSPNGMIHHNTHTVIETLKSEGLSKNQDYFIIKGKITTSELYRTLFMHRNGKIVVFDDCDAVWGDKDAANILKAALDSYDERTISWFTRQTFNVSTLTDSEKDEYFDEVDASLSDPEARVKYPSEFPYNGRIIFISNLSYKQFDSAVLTRSAKIDMTLTQDQMFHRMEMILQHLGDNSVSMEVKHEILEFLKGESATGALQGVSMRTYVAAEDLYKSGLPNWKELLSFV
jgi:hypothetical protein